MQNDIDLIYALSKGMSVQERDGVSKFKKSEYRILKRLSQLISYENSFEVSRLYLCDFLDVLNNNLLVTLRPLEESGLIEIETPRTNREVKKNFIRISINPNYCYGYSMRKTRDQAIKEWYLLRDLSETSKTDVTLSPRFQELFRSI